MKNQILAGALKSVLAASLLALFAPVTAEAAYFLISYPGSRIDATKRTHVVVSGVGEELGMLPQMAAATKIKKIAEAFPGEQIYFVAAEEKEDNEDTLAELGFKYVRHVDRDLTPDRLVTEIGGLQNIASLHYYGHSAISKGLFLDKPNGTDEVRMLPTDKAWGKLAGRFSDDAFVTLNGCNGGHILAPILSKMWGVPVAGALTGSAFETLHDDGHFYRSDREMKPYRSRSSMNIFSKEYRCSSGACVRMRPDNVIYNGHYGQYTQGLNFYKFFCVGISEEKCLSGMARSIFATVSDQSLSAKPTAAEFAHNVREWLCPVGKYGSDRQANCMSQLEALRSPVSSSARLYTPFPEGSMQCTFLTCYANPACSRPANTPQCALSEEAPDRSTTFVDEYLAYMKGFALINR